MQARLRNLLKATFVPAMVFAATLPFAPVASAISIVPSCAIDQSGKAASIDCALATFTNIAKLIFGVTGSFALLMFIVGGFFILSSAGNQEKVSQGKKYITNAVIGIFIILTAAYIVDYGESLIRGKQSLQRCSSGNLASYYTDDKGAQQQCCGQVVESNGVQKCATTCPLYAKTTGLPYACTPTKTLPDTSSCIPQLCGDTPGKSDRLCCLPADFKGDNSPPPVPGTDTNASTNAS